MANRPTGVDEAINFIWSQPDTVLQSSEKQRLSAALAKETDVVARRYFLAPLPEQWVGTLKELLAPTGIFAACGYICVSKKHMSIINAASQPFLCW